MTSSYKDLNDRVRAALQLPDDVELFAARGDSLVLVCDTLRGPVTIGLLDFVTLASGHASGAADHFEALVRYAIALVRPHIGFISAGGIVMVKCFLVEPAWDAPGTLGDGPTTRWNPERRKLLGWHRWDQQLRRPMVKYPWECGPGAMWFDYMSTEYWQNETGPHLKVVTPSGSFWDIDGRCSNCTMIADELHRCWVRHGDAPVITVDKNGLTCAAGVGSIAVAGYHGHLRNGEFTENIG